MVRSLLVMLTAVCLMAVVHVLIYGSAEPDIGARFAFPKVLPSPRLCIQQGCLVGRDLPGLDGGNQFEAFQGIPFAKPPLGELRFRNPVPVEPWSGDYEATWERSRCIQKNDVRPQQTVEGSEDCLYLNVYRPKNVSGPLPVMVFIHGGGYVSGTNYMGEIGPERFMNTKKVILVVPQYRLGVFGFLSTEDEASPGNYALKDQVLMLRWVQQNIQVFGGNPQLVTIFGQSVGASCVQYHMLSHQSKGLFSRAISMSGSVLGFWNYNIDRVALARRQAEVVGIEGVESMTSEQLVESLRKIDAVTLVRSIDQLKFFDVHQIPIFNPTVERYVDNETFISEDPRELWAAGKYHQVPFTMGFVPNEAPFVSSVLLTNRSLLNELNANSAEFIPRIVGADRHPLGIQMLKNRFFPDGTEDRWLTAENVGNLQDMSSEAFITYGIVLSVKQRLALKRSANKAPLSLYYFSFKDPIPRSDFYTLTFGDFGVCHGDELSYLFRQTALFGDYEPGSGTWLAAEYFVNYFVNIAYYGISGPRCTNESCLLLEFRNSADLGTAELNLIDGFDEEKFAFWYNVYALQDY